MSAPSADPQDDKPWLLGKRKGTRAIPLIKPKRIRKTVKLPKRELEFKKTEADSNQAVKTEDKPFVPSKTPYRRRRYRRSYGGGGGMVTTARIPTSTSFRIGGGGGGYRRRRFRRGRFRWPRDRLFQELTRTKETADMFGPSVYKATPDQKIARLKDRKSVV